MSPELLAELFGEIDDVYIQEAAPRDCIVIYKWKFFNLAAIMIIALITSALFLFWGQTNEMPNVNDTTTLVYYDGELYVADGYVWGLPEDAVFLGEINNIGPGPIDILAAENLDGNESGTIYACPNDSERLYFQMKDWKGNIGEEEKIIVLVPERSIKS